MTQSLQKLAGLFLPAEEEMTFLKLKRAKAREGFAHGLEKRLSF
jgi:hypothetical protein